MSKRFPGMDPYLEGYLWPDVHSGLAFVTKELLIPQLPEGYTVRTELYAVVDTEWQEDLGILYPDVEVRKSKLEEPAGAYDAAFTPPTAVVDQANGISNRIPSVYIRHRKNQQLITVIEYLSPVNKRSPVRADYLEKRAKLQQAKVNLLEIDPLGGENAFSSIHKLKKPPMLHAYTGLKTPATTCGPFGWIKRCPSCPCRSSMAKKMLSFRYKKC